MTVFYNVRLLDEATDSPGALFVIGGKIRAVFMGYFTNQSTVSVIADAILAEDGYSDKEVEYIDGKGLTLSPAFIDLHTHLRYPGQEQKEDLTSGLTAAAAGGYCVIVAMPNTLPVVSSEEKARAIMDEAKRVSGKASAVRLIQAVSITRDFTLADTTHLDKLDARCVPLITQDGQDVENTAAMLDAMCKAAKKGLVVSCHCEDMALARAASPLRKEALEIMAQSGLGPCGTDGFSFEAAADAYDEDDDRALESTLGGGGGNEEYDSEVMDSENSEEKDKINALIAAADTMLSLAETVAIERNLMLSQTAMCHVHIAHLSTSGGVDAVREAKKTIQDAREDMADIVADEVLGAMLTGDTSMDKEDIDRLPSDDTWQVTCEVTPHHIALCGTDEPFNRAIVNPPLCTTEDRLSLLEGIRDGTIDAIATDHAPHTASDKAQGAAGFVGLETAYAVCNTVLCVADMTALNKTQISEKRLSQLMSANPARILHLSKGLLTTGYDADLVLLDNEEKWTIDSKEFYSKGRATPFDGMEVTGRVKGLYIGGVKVDLT